MTGSTVSAKEPMVPSNVLAGPVPGIGARTRWSSVRGASTSRRSTNVVSDDLDDVAEVGDEGDDAVAAEGPAAFP